MQYDEPSSMPTPTYGEPPISGYNAPPTYTGNKTDNTATLAMLASVFLLLTSCTFGIGSCLLPLFALVAGIIGLRGANQALDQKRTRMYSWIGIVGGGIILLIFIGIIVLYGSVIAAAISSGGFETAP